MTLSDEQIERYSRQIIVPGIGGRGQERLLRSWVLLAGTDAVVRTAALYLAGAGVGRLDVGASTPTLAEELLELNPELRIRTVPLDDDGRPAGGYDAAVVAARPVESIRSNARRARHLVSAGTVGRFGWLTITDPRGTAPPCPACVALTYTNTTPEEGTPPIAGLIGSLAALETLKTLLGLGEAAAGRWLHYDGEDSTLEERIAPPSPGCALCHDREQGLA